MRSSSSSGGSVTSPKRRRPTYTPTSVSTEPKVIISKFILKQLYNTRNILVIRIQIVY